MIDNERIPDRLLLKIRHHFIINSLLQLQKCLTEFSKKYDSQDTAIGVIAKRLDWEHRCTAEYLAGTRDLTLEVIAELYLAMEAYPAIKSEMISPISSDYGNRPLTVMIIELLNQFPKIPFHIKSIIAAIRFYLRDRPDQPSDDTIYTTLSNLVNQDRIIRVEPGVYQAKAVSDES